MNLPRQSTSRSRLTSVSILFGIIGPLGMLLISGLMLLSARQDAWKAVDQTSENLLRLLEQDIAHNINLYDLSLQAVVENLKLPGLASLDPKLRQALLFDRAASASDKGVMLVLNENGDIIEDMGMIPPREANYADREYFEVQKTKADAGLFISKPLVSRLTGVPMIALSRRINKPDGSFGGVVIGTLKLSYFKTLFSRIGLGKNGAVNLFLEDGTRVARFPSVDADIGASVANSSIWGQYLRDRQGVLTAVSPRDHIERRYAFARVANLPLTLDVATSVDEVESRWRFGALSIGLVSLFLCGSTISLVLWASHEFQRRVHVEAELARLSETDGLTGLFNRRRFDDGLPLECEHTRIMGEPLSLLIVDADHFKRINDSFGHQVGDQVLKVIAQCLTVVAYRRRDLVCRLGGEEFALLLPDTDLRGAQQVAEKIHKQIASCGFWPTGMGPGTVTVSIGAACAPGWDRNTARDLYGAADAALYAAKTSGRNQTKCALQATNGTRKQAVGHQVVN